MSDDDIIAIWCGEQGEIPPDGHNITTFARAIESRVREEAAQACIHLGMTAINLDVAKVCAAAIRQGGKS